MHSSGKNMTINASVGSAGAAPTPLDAGLLSAIGAVGAEDAETAADPGSFSMMLSGMAETPLAAIEAQVLASLDEQEDPALQDPATSPADNAALAIVAALLPAIAAPQPDVQTRQPVTVASLPATAAGPAGISGLPALDESLAAAWLSIPSKVAAIDTPRDTLPSEGEAVDRLAALVAQPGGGGSDGAPAMGFSPLLQATKLGNAFAQATDMLQPQPPIQHSVGTARWAEELGTRLTLMAGQGQMSGSLTLSPEHLGPLHVQIDIKNDVANVWFGSQHADTRAALNDALPRLREMFGASGLVLGDTGVSRDTPRQEAHAAEARRFASQREDVVVGSTERGARIAHLGLLDTYA
jgi:flagellar hook-length control protein FliK